MGTSREEVRRLGRRKASGDVEQARRSDTARATAVTVAPTATSPGRAVSDVATAAAAAIGGSRSRRREGSEHGKGDHSTSTASASAAPRAKISQQLRQWSAAGSDILAIEDAFMPTLIPTVCRIISRSRSRLLTDAGSKKCKNNNCSMAEWTTIVVWRICSLR